MLFAAVRWSRLALSVIRCITALRSLSEQSAQRSISARTGSDVNDPSETSAV